MDLRVSDVLSHIVSEIYMEEHIRKNSLQSPAKTNSVYLHQSGVASRELTVFEYKTSIHCFLFEL